MAADGPSEEDMTLGTVDSNYRLGVKGAQAQGRSLLGGAGNARSLGDGCERVEKRDNGFNAAGE